MDARQFAMLCKEAQLIGSKFNDEDVDLVFDHVKDDKTRRMSFASFQSTIGIIAATKGWRSAEVEQTMISAVGSTSSTLNIGLYA